MSAVATPKGLSHPRTTQVVRRLLSDLDWSSARVADVGAGKGHFCATLGEELRARGLDPARHLFPCDRHPESFQYAPLGCARVGPDGRLPYEDGSCDVAVSIEVIEHVEDAFAFLRELARVVRPGGRVIVTTPNTLSVPSRLRTLVWGFPELFDPLPTAGADEQRLGGHIQPISPYFLAFMALRAGLEGPRLLGDRVKRSGVASLVVLGPIVLAGGAWVRARIARKRPQLLAQNRHLLADLRHPRLLTARTAILWARKPLKA